jgi:N-acetylglucosaminyl-diphospho-decaprenol L-rhamnosyltransferase
VAGTVWIIIVNYRTADLAAGCLHSIAEQIAESPGLRAIVADNDSGDGSVARLSEVINAQGWHEWASVRPLDRNGGFAFGNNAGIREALIATRQVDYVMLLNPDTIVHKGGIRALVDFMDLHQHVGIAGSLLVNADGAAECSAHNALSPLGELVSGASLGFLTRLLSRYAVTPPMQGAAHECDWVSGASLIIRREVLEAIGLLDDGYFLYFEEADFCLRARKAGWKIWFVPASRVVHLEGASTGIRNVVRRRPRYWYDSRRRYFVKHFGVLGLIVADLLWAAGRTSLALRRALRLGSGGGEQDPKWFAFDLLFGDFRSIFTGQIYGMSRKDVRP